MQQTKSFSQHWFFIVGFNRGTESGHPRLGDNSQIVTGEQGGDLMMGYTDDKISSTEGTWPDYRLGCFEWSSVPGSEDRSTLEKAKHSGSHPCHENLCEDKSEHFCINEADWKLNPIIFQRIDHIYGLPFCIPAHTPVPTLLQLAARSLCESNRCLFPGFVVDQGICQSPLGPHSVRRHRLRAGESFWSLQFGSPSLLSMLPHLLPHRVILHTMAHNWQDGEPTQRSLTTHSLGDGNTGVVNRVLISFQDL